MLCSFCRRWNSFYYGRWSLTVLKHHSREQIRLKPMDSNWNYDHVDHFVMLFKFSHVICKYLQIIPKRRLYSENNSNILQQYIFIDTRLPISIWFFFLFRFIRKRRDFFIAIRVRLTWFHSRIDFNFIIFVIYFENVWIWKIFI